MADIPTHEVHDAVIIDGCREAALASTSSLIEGESRAPRRSWEWIDHRHSDRHAHGYADLHAARHRVADPRRADGDRRHVQLAVAISARTLGRERAGELPQLWCGQLMMVAPDTFLSQHHGQWSTGPSRRSDLVVPR